MTPWVWTARDEAGEHGGVVAGVEVQVPPAVGPGHVRGGGLDDGGRPLVSEREERDGVAVVAGGIVDPSDVEATMGDEPPVGGVVGVGGPYLFDGVQGAVVALVGRHLVQVGGGHSLTPAPLLEQAAITRRVGVAAGVFAPGHIVELTRIVPFEMVDEVLAEAGAVQRRVRLVPARVTMYLLRAGTLRRAGHRQVFDRLCAGLAGGAGGQTERQRVTAGPSASGAAPMKALFDLVRGPAATTATSTRWRGAGAGRSANLAVFAEHWRPAGPGRRPGPCPARRPPVSWNTRVGWPVVCVPGCCCWATGIPPPPTC
ncbi:transposase domain-containing protein [Streptomyces sp. NRRL F-2664]|uniref:transposase domain-containing protein n=1 Tax=Streptomyces sp. NRRL F-2664 TaxID=1463842 RepID=UPI00131DFE0E|nr:transposase domain-containing protein [Streptomyces sp. NRRL F-2664]